MSEKKETASTVSRMKGSGQAPEVGQSKAKGARRFKVEFYPDGVALTAPAPGRLSAGSGNNPRGKIKGWSKASRRRMREFLLTHPIKEGFDCYAVTYTIPGPVLAPADAKRLFHNWQMSLNRAGGCAVWRLEVQERGAMHWHIIAGLPEDRRPIDLSGAFNVEDLKQFIAWKNSVPDVVSFDAMTSGAWVNASRLSELWFNALDTLGAIERPIKSRPDCVEVLRSRSEWVGAKQHAVRVEPMPDVFGAWKRYLQDHNTKSKQEQIAEGFGRHWGVIGRKHFRQALPDSVADLNLRQYSAFLRAYQRLCTPQRVAPWSIFGRCLGHTSRRGRSGRSVYFSNPSTVERLVLWAGALPDQLPPVPRWHDIKKPLQKLKAGQAVDGTPSPYEMTEEWLQTLEWFENENRKMERSIRP